MATAQERPSRLTIPADALAIEEARAENRHRVLLSLSDDMKGRIDDLIHRTGYDQGELLDVAIACFMMGLDAVEEGKRVGIIEEDGELSTEFTGFHKNDPTDG